MAPRTSDKYRNHMICLFVCYLDIHATSALWYTPLLLLSSAIFSIQTTMLSTHAFYSVVPFVFLSCCLCIS